MKKVLLLFLMLTGLVVHAQIPNGYYNNANGKTGEELKAALHDIIKGHTSISYNQIWNAYYSTDHRDDDVSKVWDIYSDIPNGTPRYLFDLGSDQCGSYDNEGYCYNREHSWPDSWFNSDATARTDLHHIFPTDGFVNNQRSNHPYGEVQSATWTSTNGSKLGNCTSSLGYSGTVFEPINAYKGDLARAYFYMSVRYYTEDSSWGSSGMTNKSVLKDWALAMLLRWNDLDPVSQKEIDRNNVIYNDYQHNRNPFIDHPEYARMIWDPSWTGGSTYNITCTTGLSHGSVSAPETALEGSTVAITAIPEPGYMVDSYLVYKTGNPSTTVAVSSNGTFTMPGYAVTVSASFKINNTYYNIALGEVSHGSIHASSSTATSGTTITLTATPASGYSLYSWYVFKTGDMNSTVTVNGNSFVMPAFNVTVTASFIQGSVGHGDFVKVTETPTDWEGEYLLVYEQSTATGYVWTGVDQSNCYVSKPITDNTIGNDNFVTLMVSAMTGGYSIKINGGTNNGKYIYGSSGSNGISFASSPSLNSISLESNSAKITSNTSVLRYNTSAKVFRYYKSATYAQQGAVQLYKKIANTTTPTHTIHFDNNGGMGSMDDQTVNEYEATALQANTFTREGYVFDGWNTTADGTGDFYADQASVSLLDDLTLYAQWEQLYTITLAATANGSISANPTQAIEETLITLTAIPEEGYEFGHWTISYNGNSTIEVTDNQFEMPAANVIVSATFVLMEIPFEQQYILVTSTDQLLAGRTYLIVNTQYGKALGTTQNSNNRAAAHVTVNGELIESIGTTVCELTLGGSPGQWTLKDGSKGYLYAAGGSGNNNYLRTQTTLTNEGKWTITLDTDGKATIKTISTSVSRHTIMYNHSGDIFSCYASGQQDVQLFIRSEEIHHTSNETISQFFPFDKHLIHEGACLSFEGTLSNTDPSHLVIEDGGQLIHHNDGVKATFKKNITSYEGSLGGWYTLASPFNLFTPSQVTEGTYDLFVFDEDAPLEWVNYKTDATTFPVSPGIGYLYAHVPDITLSMTGTLNNGDYSETVPLSYGNSHEFVKGFNLLGNPTAHSIIFTKSDNVADGYYYHNDSDLWYYEPGNMVPAGRGFLVKANASGQTVTLNPSVKHNGEETPSIGPLLRIDVDGEQAFIKLAQGVNMPLLNPKGHCSSVYLALNGNPYIMIATEQPKDIELCFQPKKNGQHRLRLTAENADLDYLHLIDRSTGADIDLLQHPNYGFESGPNDQTERFQLLFSPR